MEWSSEQLAVLAKADDFHVAPFREDGQTCGTPTFIWSVVTDGGLFIRAYGGTSSSWYQAAKREGAGCIEATGERFAVRFAPVEDPDRNDSIDAAYREKYADSNYLKPMISDRARAATIQVHPREDDA